MSSFRRAHAVSRISPALAGSGGGGTQPIVGIALNGSDFEGVGSYDGPVLLKADMSSYLRIDIGWSRNFCRFNDANGKIYFSNSWTPGLLVIGDPVEGSTGATDESDDGGSRRPLDCCFDNDNGYCYWVRGESVIGRSAVDLAGSSVDPWTVASFSDIKGIDIHPTTKNLYVAGNGGVEQIKPDKTKTSFSATHADTVRVAPVENALYVVDTANNQLRKIDIETKAETTLQTYGSLSKGLAVDEVNSELWLSIGGDLTKTDLGGANGVAQSVGGWTVGTDGDSFGGVRVWPE